jgi:hypothetical protein
LALLIFVPQEALQFDWIVPQTTIVYQADLKFFGKKSIVPSFGQRDRIITSIIGKLSRRGRIHVTTSGN